MILLNADQAEAVRGPNPQGTAALDPRETAIAGIWALNEAVLTDPQHEAHHDYLACLPRGPVVWPIAPE